MKGQKGSVHLVIGPLVHGVDLVLLRSLVVLLRPIWGGNGFLFFQSFSLCLRCGSSEMFPIVRLKQQINVFITQGADFGWTSITSLSLAAISIIGIIVFILYERKRRNALIDFKLFKSGPYTGATVSNFFLNAVAGTLIVANTYVQVGRG